MRHLCGSNVGIFLKSPCHRLVLLLILGLSPLLNGCGFSLRGGAEFTGDFVSIELAAEGANREFLRLLERALTVADVEVATVNANLSAPGPEQPTLSIGPEELFVSPVTVNPRARAAQYEVRLAVPFSLRIGSESLLSDETLVIERSYYEVIENIAGSRAELELLATEMRRELVNQLVVQLEAVTRQQ